MYNKFRENDLEFGCKLISEVTNIPICVLDKHDKIILDHSYHLTYNPMFSSKQDHLKSIDILISAETLPRVYTTEYLEHFVLIPVVQHGAYSGTIILGPTTSPKPSKIFLDDIITANGLEKIDSDIRDYFYSLPVISSWKLLHISVLLSYVIYKKKFDIKEVINKNQLIVDDSQYQELSEKNISVLRQNAYFHHDPVSEKKLYQFVTDGNKEDLLLYYKAFHQMRDFKFGTLSRKSELRNQKNRKIAVITLATRAAIAGGLHPEIAYTLGDIYIQEMEELHTVKDVEIFIENAICEFAERVNKNKRQQYSKPISYCQDYIFKHLYENISLSVLAEHVSMNPKYLSNLFKKEVGISVTEYIQRTKIDEVIKLMTFSNYSLSEIYTLLNFTDQSYFTKVFKKYTDLTPKQYIKQNNR